MQLDPARSARDGLSPRKQTHFIHFRVLEKVKKTAMEQAGLVPEMNISSNEQSGGKEVLCAQKDSTKLSNKRPSGGTEAHTRSWYPEEWWLHGFEAQSKAPEMSWTAQMMHVWLCSPVFSPPAFDEAHANGAHPGQLVDRFKALVDRLSQQGCKFLVVEYF